MNDQRDAELTERLLTESELGHPTKRPGVEFHRATWVLVVIAVILGLTILGGVFWWIFAGSRQ